MDFTTTDGGFATWSGDFTTKIVAQPTLYGLVAGQSTAYQALDAAYQSAYAESADPQTRTRGKIQAKSTAKEAALAYARELIRIIQACPTVTNEMRADLGIHIADDEATPSNPPTEAPVLTVESSSGHRVTVRLRQADSSRRGRLPGAACAVVLSYVGTEAPVDKRLYNWMGSTTKTKFDVEFPADVPSGAQVFLVAMWQSPMMQNGPACDPVRTFIGGGIAQAS